MEHKTFYKYDDLYDIIEEVLSWNTIQDIEEYINDNDLDEDETMEYVLNIYPEVKEVLPTYTIIDNKEYQVVEVKDTTYYLSSFFNDDKGTMDFDVYTYKPCGTNKVELKHIGEMVGSNQVNDIKETISICFE